MRQTCNAAYAALVEGMTEKERHLFDGRLRGRPTSYGTAALRQMMMGGNAAAAAARSRATKAKAA